MVPHYWFGWSRIKIDLPMNHEMLWFLNMIWNLFISNSRNDAPFSVLVITKKKCSWLDPAYSWNKQLAHTPFPKKINTPSTTLRFIGFVAKISVLNPKLPANGQWTKETKESVTFFIWSPLFDRLKKKKKNGVLFFVSLHPPFFFLFST